MTVLLVSWILTLLSVFSLTFNQEVRMDLRLSRGESEEARSFALARSGIALAGELLARSAENSWDAPGEGWEHNPALRKVPLEEGYFSVGYRSEGSPVYGVEDEGRRIPLSMLDAEILGRLPDVSSEDVEKVLAAVGAAPEGVFLDPAALPGLEETTRRTLAAYVTPFSGFGININTAPPVVLEAIGIPEQAVRRIVARRLGRDGQPATDDDAPFTSLLVPEGGLDELDLDSEEAAVLSILAREEFLGVASTVFRLRSRGWIADTRTYGEIETVVERNESGTLEVLDWRETWQS